MLVTFTELEINGEEHEKVTNNIHYADGFAQCRSGACRTCGRGDDPWEWGAASDSDDAEGVHGICDQQQHQGEDPAGVQW